MAVKPCDNRVDMWEATDPVSLHFFQISICSSHLKKHQKEAVCALKERALLGERSPRRSGFHMEKKHNRGDNVVDGGKTEIRSEVFGSVEYTMSW